MEGGEFGTAQGCYWRGEFGGTYLYEIYELPVSDVVDCSRSGNYIYAKRDAAGQWLPVYIGTDGFAACGLSQHPRREVIERGGATHFHFHAVGDELERDAEKDDILAFHFHVMSSEGGSTPVSEFQHPERLRAYSKLPPTKRGKGRSTGVGDVTPRHIGPFRPKRQRGDGTS